MVSHQTPGIEWGGAADMNAWEAFMWRAEGDRRTRSTGVLLEILDSEPDWDLVRIRHEHIIQQIPRLRDRVVDPPLPLICPAWSPDPDFDLSYHLRHVRLPEPGTLRQLLDLTASIEAQPLDTSRPLWEATLVTGLDDGRAAYLLKVHHSLSDGLGLLQLVELTHSHTPETDDQKPAPDKAARPHLTPTTLLTERLRSGLAAAPAGIARRSGQAAQVVRRAFNDPGGLTAEALRFGFSLRRMLAPAPVERSPMLRTGSHGYQLVTHDIPLADLRTAAKAAGGSVNDAFLAGLLGAFRRMHEHHGTAIERLPLAIPISLRSPTDPMGGNRFAGARFAAPVSEPDPQARIDIIRDFVVNAKAEPAIGFLDLVTPALNRLPRPMLTEIASRMTNVCDVQASNIPGLSHPVYLAGAKVVRMYPMGPRPGVAAMITMISYNGTCCLGVNLDPAVIPDTTVFADHLRDGFNEVLALRPDNKE